MREIGITIGVGVLIGYILVSLSGCAFGGAKETNNVILCEPGAVCRIATDEKIDVIATTDDGKKALCKKNMAGTVAMPDTVYQQLRECWNKAHGNEQPSK